MKKIKIFLSSTFSDMNAERDVIIHHIMPRLREMAEKQLGIQVQEVDLRWGVTEEQANRGEVESLCLEGIEECRPYFLCMLGARYGWIPAPGFIRLDDYDRCVVESKLLSDSEKALVASSYHKAAGEKRVYTLDQTLPFRTKEMLQQILEKAGVPNVEKSITHKEIDYAGHSTELPRFITELEKKIAALAKDSALSDDEYALVKKHYVRSGGNAVWRLLPGVTDAERRPLLSALHKAGIEIHMHKFYFFRDDTAEGFYDGPTGSLYQEQVPGSVPKLRQLKQAIRDSNNYEICRDFPCTWTSKNSGREEQGIYPINGLDEMGEMIFTSLWSHMQENPELVQDEIEEKDEIEQELELHHKFIDSRTYNFQGRKEMLSELKTAADAVLCGNAESQYVMVVGEPGSGKSALLAKFYLDYTAKYNNYLVIPWFVGASRRSTNPRHILIFWCKVLIKEFDLKEQTDEGEKEYEIPSEIKELKLLFEILLKQSSKPVVIVIDAINQLQKSENAREMKWLKEKLPENICIITSLVEDTREKEGFNIEEDETALLSMRNRKPSPHEIPVKRLSKEEKEEISVSYLRQYNKTLPKELLQILLGKKEAYNPLYLQVALEELRIFSRHDLLEDFIANKIPDTAEDMFDFLLDRIETDFNSRFETDLNRNLFAEFMQFIALGRNGMSEFDLRMLLGNWQELKSLKKPDKISGEEYDEWKKEREKLIQKVHLSDFYLGELKRWIRMYLLQRGDEYDFFHQQLKQAVGKKYLRGQELALQCHKTIADYLELMGYEHITTVRDLPHHLLKIVKTKPENDPGWNRLTNILCDIIFIEARGKAELLNEMQSDYTESLDALHDEENKQVINAYYRTFKRKKHILGAYPKIIFQTLYNELQWNKGKIGEYAEIAKAEFIKQGKAFLHQYRTPEKTMSSLIMTLTGHSKGVAACAFSPDGRKIVSASDDCTLKLWDAETGEEIHTLTGHSMAVRACAFSPDGTKIVSGSIDEAIHYEDQDDIEYTDNTLKLWDAETGEEIRTLTGHRRDVLACAFSPDGTKIVSVSFDNTLKLWDAETGEEIRTFTGPDGVDACAFSPDGTKFVSSEEFGDNTLKLWDAETGEEIRTLTGHRRDVLACAFSPDGRKIVSASDDCTLKLWDAETGEEIRTLTGHSRTVNSCAFSPDGRKIVSGSWRDNTLKLWDAETGEEIRTLTAHSGDCYSCAFSPDGRKIVSGSHDSTLKLWDAEASEEIHTLTGHRELVAACAFSPDGTKIVSVSWDNTLKLWDAETGEEIRTLTGIGRWVKFCAFSPDGRKIVSEGTDETGDNTLKIWDAETGEEIHTLTGHSGSVGPCAYSPDGTKIVSGSSDGTLRIWDAETGEEIRTLTGHRRGVGSCAFSPDGRKIVSSGRWSDEPLKIWDAETGEEIRTLTGFDFWVDFYAFSPDGRKIVFGSWDKTLKIWDAETGEEIHTLHGHSVGVRTRAFSSDGTKIVSGSSDGTLKLWDAETSEEIRTLTAHSDMVYSCAFSPDGTKIVSGSGDNTLKLWDAETGEEIRTLTGHREPVAACAFSPDGTKIVSGSWDKTLKLWDAETGEEIRTLTGIGSYVDFCAFSPDGTKIVSGSSDYTLKLWDAETGEEICSILTGHSVGVRSRAISPDGRKIVFGSWDETLKLWDAETGEEIHTLTGHSVGVHYRLFSPDGRKIVSSGRLGDDKTLKLWDAETGEEIARLAVETEISSCSMSFNGTAIACGDSEGSLYLFKLVGSDIGLPVITPLRLWLTGDKNNSGTWSPDITAGCTHCGKRFAVDDSMPGKEVACPNCHGMLKLNELVVDNKEIYEKELQHKKSVQNKVSKLSSEEVEEFKSNYSLLKEIEKCPVCVNDMYELDDTLICSFCGLRIKNPVKPVKRKRKIKHSNVTEI